MPVSALAHVPIEQAPDLLLPGLSSFLKSGQVSGCQATTQAVHPSGADPDQARTLQLRDPVDSGDLILPVGPRCKLLHHLLGPQDGPPHNAKDQRDHRHSPTPTGSRRDRPTNANSRACGRPATGPGAYRPL